MRLDRHTRYIISIYSFLLSICLLDSGITTAQNSSDFDQLLFHNLTVDEGLSHNRVNDICQDEMGFIWLATENGLNRYDGYEVKTYRYYKGEAEVVKDVVKCVFSDSKHHLWVGASELRLFDKNQEKYAVFYPTADSSYIIRRPLRIIEDSKHTLWVVCYQQGVFSINLSTLETTHFKHNPEESNSLSSPRYETVFLDSEDRLWIGNHDHGLDLFDKKNNTFTKFRHEPSNPKSLSGSFVTSIFEDRHGAIWVGTYSSGLNAFDEVDSTFHRIHIDPENQSSDRVMTIFENLDGELYFGTRAGLYKYQPETKTFYHAAHTAHRFSPMSYNSIIRSYIDNAGVLWLGTSAGGALYTDLYLNTFRHHRSVKNNRQYLNDMQVNTIWAAENGDMLIGTGQGGVNAYDASTQLYSYYLPGQHRQNSILHNDIEAIAVDDEGDWWIGTNNRGLNSYNPKTKKFKAYQHDEGNDESLMHNIIRSLLFRNRNELWIGTINGLSVLDLQSQKFTNYYLDEDVTNNIKNIVNAIYKDSDGNMWVGGSIYLPDQDTFSFVIPDSIPKSHTIYSICEDQEGCIWFASSFGLIRFNRANSTTNVYTSTHGLPANNILAILPDDLGFLWASTEVGLLKIDPKPNREGILQVKTFSASDGLQGSHFNPGACFKDARGMLYFGGTNGFNSFNPGHIYRNPNPPHQVVFTSLEVSNSMVEIGDEVNGQVILNNSISNTQELTLNYKQDNFTISFAAIHFSAPERNTYRYRMKNYNDNWFDIGNQRKATFINLPPGEYEFEVVAASYEGITSEEPASMKITILPPWWKTLWFRLLIVFFILALVFGSFFLRLRAIKLRNILLENQVKQKTATLLEQNKQILEQNEEIRAQKDKIESISKKVHEADQAKLSFFINLSHDFRTPLTVIMGHLDSLFKKYGKAEGETFKTMNRNISHLQFLINDIMEIRKIDKGELTLEITEFNLCEVMSNVYASFFAVAEKKNIALMYEEKYKMLPVFLDKRKVIKVLQNLISNAIKFTLQGKSISLSISEFDKRVEITVSDTGQGIEPDHQKKIFDRFFRTPDAIADEGHGIGLSLVKSYVEAQKGSIQVHSVPGRGSDFILTFPKKDEELQKLLAHRQDEKSDYSIDKFEYETEKAEENEIELKEAYSVMVVEDNYDLRSYLVKSLNSNFSVIAASNGKEALQKIKQATPDLIISDIMMPEMDGIQFCKQIKSDIQNCHIPFIILTAKGDTETEIAGFKLGIDEYLSKPFKNEVLVARILALLDNRNKLHKAIRSGQLDIQKTESINKLDKEFLIRVHETIKNNFHRPELSVEYISQQISMGKTTFFQKYKKLTGDTINDYITKTRMKKAADLLRHDGLSIKETSYEVGYKSRSHFSSVFKDYFKRSPKDYIEQYRI